MTKAIQIPGYLFDGLIRHMERMIADTRPKDMSPRARDIYRLARIDLVKLKRIKSQTDEN